MSHFHAMFPIMFVRVKSTPNSPRKSVQIVQSVRHGKKVRQRIVRHVGIANSEQELPHLKHLAEILKAQMQEQNQPSFFTAEETALQIQQARQQQAAPAKALQVQLQQLRGETAVSLGIYDVYGELYQQVQLHRILPRYRYQASNPALFYTVMARIANPDSKRASVRRLGEEFGVRLSLEKVYRMMDYLSEEVPLQRLQRWAAKNAQQQLQEPLDVLFFDCTTLYFESFVEDELKQPGDSKDAKFKESQVLLALMVTPQGLPLSYELLPGATFEGHSLLAMVARLRTDFKVQNVICVADRGMLNNHKLQQLQEAGLYYIVGARLKNLPQKLQAQVLNLDQYQASLQSGVRILSLAYGQRRVIVSHCKKRARKDRHDREKAVNKLLKKLNKSQSPKALMSNCGYKRFVRMQGHSRVLVDQNEIEQAQKWDGLHGVVTNVPTMTDEQVLSHYRGLWQVEQSFRITQQDLKVRPIFHWTPRRVQAHIAISFMALMCVRHLQYRIGLQQQRYSPQVIREALLKAQYCVVEHRKYGQRNAIPMQLPEVAKKLYAAMGIRRSMTTLVLQKD